MSVVSPEGERGAAVRRVMARALTKLCSPTGAASSTSEQFQRQNFLAKSQRNTIAMDAFDPCFNAQLNSSSSPAKLFRPANYNQLSNEAAHANQFASNREGAVQNHEDSTVVGYMTSVTKANRAKDG